MRSRQQQYERLRPLETEADLIAAAMPVSRGLDVQDGGSGVYAQPMLAEILDHTERIEHCGYCKDALEDDSLLIL